MGLDHIDWSLVNTTLLLGAITYLYRQSRVVDQVRQAVFGLEGQGGILSEVKLLRERSHDLANKMGALSGAVEELNRTLVHHSGRGGL